MFRTVPLWITKSFSLYTQQWYMSYRFADSLRAGSGWNWVPSWSCSQAVSKPVWHIPLLCVQWKTPNDGQRNCPKYVEFHSKNKFEKLVHLVGFIIRNAYKVLSHRKVRSKAVLLKLHELLHDKAIHLFITHPLRRAGVIRPVTDYLTHCVNQFMETVWDNRKDVIG
jgi:hypothetical protein